MFVLVGLGNPGKKYDGTRHNIGFAVIDAIAASLNVSLKSGLGEYQIVISKSLPEEIALVKPTTYMNNSGLAVKRVLKQYNAGLENLLVIVDDYQLSLGAIRLRKGGSAGGHNGLSSIIDHLGTNEFPRLRCGIGGDHLPKPGEAKSDYVLDRFNKREQAIVEIMIVEARDAAIVTATKGMDKAMTTFNSK